MENKPINILPNVDRTDGNGSESEIIIIGHKFMAKNVKEKIRIEILYNILFHS